MTITVSPTAPFPSHHVSLTDQLGNSLGFIAVDSQGNPDVHGISRSPLNRTALKTTSGNMSYSDFDLPWVSAAQIDWTGGRGADIWEQDITRFYDSKRANTYFNSITNGPLEVYTTGYRGQNFSLPGSMSWQNLYGTATYIATRFAASANYSATAIYLYIRRYGMPTGTLTVELCADSGGGTPTPSTVLQTATVTSITIDDTLSILYKFAITAQALTSGTYYWIKVYSDNTGTATNHWKIGINNTVSSVSSELLPNGDAEHGNFSHWTKTTETNGAWYVISSEKYGGSYSFSFRPNTISALGSGVLTSDRVGATAAVNYYLAGYMNSLKSISGTFKIEVNWYNHLSAGSIIKTDILGTVTANAANTWIKFNEAFTAPTGTLSFAFVLTATNIRYTGIKDFNSVAFDGLSLSVWSNYGVTKQSTAGSTWVQSIFDLYYRVTDADVTGTPYFFKYKGVEYFAVDAAGAVKVYINGDRGAADANTTELNHLVDATKSWTTNQWAGCIVKIVTGLGITEPTTWRMITANSATKLTVDPVWTVVHDTTTEYVIVNSNTWSEVTGHGLVTPLTDVLVNNFVYFAQGEGATSYIRRMRHIAASLYTWAADGTNKATKLASCRSNTGTAGKLAIWKSNNADPPTIAKAAYPASWANLAFGTAISFSDEYGLITSMLEYYNNLWIMREGMPFFLDITATVPAKMPLAEISTLAAETNGIAAIQHGVYLVFNWGYGLERYYNTDLEDIGPNREEGLPTNRQGIISALLGYAGRYFATVDADTTGYSSVLVNSLTGGGTAWHEEYRAPAIGQRILAMDFETIPGNTPDRLWVSVGGDIIWLYQPSKTNKQSKDSNYRYTHESVVESAWIVCGLFDVWKFYHSVKLFTKNLSAGAIEVELNYKADDDTNWTAVDGLFDISPKDENNLVADWGVSGKQLKLRWILRTNNNSITPEVKQSVLETIARVSVKRGYTLAYRSKDYDIDLVGAKDTNTVAQRQTIIENWIDEITPLTMHCVMERYDNKVVYIEPAPDYPNANNEESYIDKLVITQI